MRTNQPDCYSVFILPPSVAELERRLRGRKSDSEDVIARRLGEAVDDISHWSEFDHVVVNDDVESATRALLAIMSDTPAGTSTADPGVRERTTALLGT